MLNSFKRSLKNYLKNRSDKQELVNAYGALPLFKLPTVTLGNPKYGAWTLCPRELNASSVVYSIGVGEDISFDRELCEKYGVQLFTFDPTPRSITFMAQQTLLPNFHFVPLGIADHNGTANFFPPQHIDHVSHSFLEVSTRSPIAVEVKTLSSLMALNQHTHLSLLKMDIEGAEYQVLDQIFTENVQIDQLLVEFHDRFPTIGRSKTLDTIQHILAADYSLFAISPSYEEFSFIHHRAL